MAENSDMGISHVWETVRAQDGRQGDLNLDGVRGHMYRRKGSTENSVDPFGGLVTA